MWQRKRNFKIEKYSIIEYRSGKIRQVEVQVVFKERLKIRFRTMDLTSVRERDTSSKSQQKRMR